MEYFGLKLGLDLGNRVAHPYQEFRGVPPPPPGGEVTFAGNLNKKDSCNIIKVSDPFIKEILKSGQKQTLNKR